MPDDYRFLSERLDVHEWHAASRAGANGDVPGLVAAMLTEPVTRWLPPSWHGPYTRERAAAWIAERDAEGPVLLIESRESGEPLGLILLFEERVGEGVAIRLGYLLAEHAWNRGYGSEVLGGFVAWSRERGNVRSITGGVAPENTASIRLLERHGFLREPGRTPDGDITYRLELSGGDGITGA